MNRLVFVSLIALPLLIACSDRERPVADTGSPPDDTSVMGDTSLPDTNVPDTSPPEDTNAPDTTSPDTGSPDTGSPDSGMDAGGEDTGGTDAGPDAAPDAPDAGVDAPPGACAPVDLMTMMGESIRMGDLGATSEVDTTCAGFTDGPDKTFTWTAPRDGTFVFDTNGSDSSFDTGIELREMGCGELIDCDDDGGEGTRSLIRHTMSMGDVVTIVVFGYNGGTGNYVLNVTEDMGSTETMCMDDMDNDRDGDTDCADFDCRSVDGCTETMCADGLDDDGDDDTDCADTDCRDDPACIEDCGDGIDNDADGLVDCDDFDCSGDDLCRELDCADGIDNDDDTRIDCDDFDCDDDPACSETNCSDGVDDEGDGLVDCADFDCSGDDACDEDVCDDSIDDDMDGFTDCMDSECACDAACATDTCPDENLGRRTGAAVSTGRVEGMGACSRGIRRGSCAGNGPELTFRFRATAAGTYTIDTAGSDADTVLYILDGATCAGAEELACDDDGGDGTESVVTVDLIADQQIVIVVDTFSSAGDYILNITAP